MWDTLLVPYVGHLVNMLYVLYMTLNKVCSYCKTLRIPYKDIVAVFKINFKPAKNESSSRPFSQK